MLGQFSDTPQLRTLFGQKSAQLLGHRTDSDRFSFETGTTNAQARSYSRLEWGTEAAATF